MTHIPVIVKAVDDVVPSGSVDKDSPDLMGKITSCFNCGGLLFYQVVMSVVDAKHAIDISIYCAVCGQSQGGIVSDPFGETDPVAVDAEWWRMVKWDTMPETWGKLSSEIKEEIREAGLAPKGAGGNA